MNDTLFDIPSTDCPSCGRRMHDNHCNWCNDLPVTPYAGTSGWSGSDTSKARAVRNGRDGTTTARQMRTPSLLRDAGVTGLTWKEMSDITGEHHGQVSGSLSNLHKGGLIARLSESRSRCKVYVLPEHVSGRDTEPFGRKPSDRSSTSPVPVPTTDTHGPGYCGRHGCLICESDPNTEDYYDDDLVIDGIDRYGSIG